MLPSLVVLAYMVFEDILVLILWLNLLLYCAINSALHPSGVAKLSTSFGWGKVGKSPLPGSR